MAVRNHNNPHTHEHQSSHLAKLVRRGKWGVAENREDLYLRLPVRQTNTLHSTATL